MSERIGDVVVSVDGPYVVISGASTYFILGASIEEASSFSDCVKLYKPGSREATFAAHQSNPADVEPTLHAIRRAALEAGQWRRG